MEIKKINSIDTYPVRHEVLRKGKPIETCQFKGDSVKLKGTLTARIFKRNETPIEVAPETELNELK